MEAFSLLKYWRSNGGGSGCATTTIFSTDSTANARATPDTIGSAASDSPYSSDGEGGPYFDLEFSLLDQESDVDEGPPEKSQENDQNAQETENEDETASEFGEISVHENDDDEEGELTDQTVPALSPSDELFFQGNLVSVEPSSILLNEENSKLPVFLVKSATKFRVLLLNKLKKSKSSNGENILEKEHEALSEKDEVNGKKVNQRNVSGKFMAVKFNVEEGPLVSLFTRDNSSKENGHGRGLKNNAEDHNTSDSTDHERKLTKEVMLQKYLKMVKPFYIRVSKRYVEKLKFSGHLGGGGAENVGQVVAAAARGNVKTQLKQGNSSSNLQAGLEVVRKHLGKSRSASAAVAAVPPGKATSSNRRDDSLVELQDGIQGAILHCKRSFNTSRESSSSSSSILFRSVSDPSYEKSVMMPPETSSSAAASSSSSSSSSSFSEEAKES